MAEKGIRYGNTPIPPSGAYDAAAEAKLKSLEEALRVDILSNARKQYESAALELRLRAQTEARVYAEAQAQTQLHAHRQKQYHASEYARTVQMHERARSQPRPTAHPYDQMRRINSTKRPEMPSRCAPQWIPPRPSSNVPSPSPNTPSHTIYGFRQDPKQAGSSTAPRLSAEGSVVDGNNLSLEELKRRYYAQLTNPNHTDPVIAYTDTDRAKLYRGTRQVSSGTAIISNNNHPRTTNLDHYGYGRGLVGSSRMGQVRSMADEYLDYYMPPRRGPHSVSTYPSRTNLSREAQYAPRRRETPERVYEQDQGRDMRYYYDTHIHAEDSSRHEVSNNRQELVEPFDSGLGRTAKAPESPIVTREPAVSTLPPSKGRLAFLLNPTASSSNSTANPQERGLQAELHRRNDSPPFPNRSDPRSPEDEIRHKQISSSRNNVSKPSSRPIEAASSLHSNTDTRIRSASSGNSLQPPPRDLSHTSLANYNHNRRYPAKRKAPSDSPDIKSSESDASSEREEEEEEEEKMPPRAKRRAFGRLPVEYDSSQSSELGPEEEETDEEAYHLHVAEIEARTRHKSNGSIPYPTATNSKSTSRIPMESDLQLGHGHVKQNDSTKSRTRGSESESAKGNVTRLKARSSGGPGDDNKDGMQIASTDEKQAPSSPSGEEHKKYDFRPRARTHF